MPPPEHPRVAEVERLLRAAGAPGEVRHLPDSARTAATAAAQLGIEVGAIANSLVFDVGGDPLLVLTSGAHRVDEARVAALLGVPGHHARHPGVRPPAHRPGDRRRRPARASRADRHPRRHRAGPVRAGLGGRGPPAHRLPHHLRRAAPAHRRHARRGRRRVRRRPADRAVPGRGDRRPMTGTKPSTRIDRAAHPVAARPHVRGAHHLRPGDGVRLRRRRRPVHLRDPAHRASRLPRRGGLRRDARTASSSSASATAT